MTREEAIRILDPATTAEALAEIEYYAGFRGEEAARRAVDDVCILAISALREQEERERGCEYRNCGKSVCNNGESMDEDVYISGNCLIVEIGCHSYWLVKINFCPMCGRRLYLPKPTTAEANN